MDLGFRIQIVRGIPDYLSCILDSKGQDADPTWKNFPDSGNGAKLISTQYGQSFSNLFMSLSVFMRQRSPFAAVTKISSPLLIITWLSHQLVKQYYTLGLVNTVTAFNTKECPSLQHKFNGKSKYFQISVNDKFLLVKLCKRETTFFP